MKKRYVTGKIVDIDDFIGDPSLLERENKNLF